MGSFPQLVASVRLNSLNPCNFNKKTKISPKNNVEDLFHLKPHLRPLYFKVICQTVFKINKNIKVIAKTSTFSKSLILQQKPFILSKKIIVRSYQTPCKYFLNTFFFKIILHGNP